jgi:hypothetical protein
MVIVWNFYVIYTGDVINSVQLGVSENEVYPSVVAMFSRENADKPSRLAYPF